MEITKKRLKKGSLKISRRFLKNEKSNNMSVNVIKISLNTKNRNWLSIEKNITRKEKKRFTMQNKVRLKICIFFWISVKKFFGIFLFLVIIRN